MAYQPAIVSSGSNRPFANRREAGKELATKLSAYRGRHDVVVLALPRGGVPVAFEVAEALDAPLDIFLVRKLGMPGHPEFAMGAIASGGVRVLNEEVILSSQLSANRSGQRNRSEPVALQESPKRQRLSAVTSTSRELSDFRAKAMTKTD